MSAGQPGNKLVRILLDVSLDTLMHICDLVHQMCAKCILLYTYVTNIKNYSTSIDMWILFSCAGDRKQYENMRIGNVLELFMMEMFTANAVANCE